jgi:hypothetical protein
MSTKIFNISNVVPQLVNVLKRRITAYHTMFSLPLIAEQWEETLHRSFQEIGFQTSWLPDRSHKIGEDLNLIGIPNTRISCKSGQFVKNTAMNCQCVKFNGSRSTTYKTLDEKINHFCKDHDDYYFLLAKEKPFNGTYKLLVFKSDICKVNKLTWTENASGKQWEGCGEFSAMIGKTMSAQLWTTLPLKSIASVSEIVIPEINDVFLAKEEEKKEKKRLEKDLKNLEREAIQAAKDKVKAENKLVKERERAQKKVEKMAEKMAEKMKKKLEREELRAQKLAIKKNKKNKMCGNC